ncbi:MAG TPA: hypothetical protein VMV46_00035 [Thermoanaerobaculia bacterium]|nr:hypothetical protein [Thermoanaerobaculia bacterium]
MKNLLPFVFALGTAVCWGLYGPTLGRARIADADLSPFKPYVAIGFAYLVIAIAGGMAGMWWKGDSFSPSGAGAGWGLAAGTLGALGAFNLTLAMFTGGARIPHAVMPVVFGGAVTVTALYTVLASKGRLHSTPMLWLGIALMLVAVVIITRNTPHAPPEAAPAPSAEQAPAPSHSGDH